MLRPPSKDCNCPLKMNIIERILWFTMVISMLIVIAIGRQNQYSQLEEAQEKSQGETVIKKQRSLVILPIQNGLQIYKDLEKEPLKISKITPNQVASAGIKVESLDIGYYEYKNSVSEIIYRGPNGWEYYKNPYWNPEIDAKVMGNVSKIYFKEKEDKIIQITLTDTSGGKYDKDIEALIEILELHGGTFGG